jgi:radical SAM superfamily enzyme YgiQ (UPF0313 family)
MGKPGSEVYREFVRVFEEMNKKTGKEQYIVPYLMSSHPGSTLKDAVTLAEYIRELGYMPEQVQDFYPTPGTVSTCMYYTGLDPLTWKEARSTRADKLPDYSSMDSALKDSVHMEKVYVARDPHEKAMQRALIQYRDPANYDLVKEALLRTGRTDLIGFGEKCLIPPRRMKADNSGEKKLGKNRPARAKLQGTGGTKGNFKAGRGKPASGKGKTVRRKRER